MDSLDQPPGKWHDPNITSGLLVFDELDLHISLCILAPQGVQKLKPCAYSLGSPGLGSGFGTLSDTGALGFIESGNGLALSFTTPV